MPMKVLLALLLLTSVAGAKEITITLNDEEQKALMQLMDQATRAGGLQAADPALYFVRKIQTAQQSPPPATTPGPEAQKDTGKKTQ